MKQTLLAFYVLALSACSAPEPIRPAIIVIYDTIADPSQAMRAKYRLQPEYNLFYDSAAKGYLATFHFGDINEDVYLYDVGPLIMVYYTKKYAQVFKRPSDALKVIKKHWSAVLADRASHSK